jgi:hypothetical protein
MSFGVLIVLALVLGSAGVAYWRGGPPERIAAAVIVGWILIEEKSEGGDMLAKISRADPRFLDGFSRVCEGSGIALYRRQNRMLNVAR